MRKIKIGDDVILKPTTALGIETIYNIYNIDHREYGDFPRMVGTLIHYHPSVKERNGHRWGVSDWMDRLPYKGGRVHSFRTFADAEKFMAGQWS